MRDPAATLRFESDRVVRALRVPLARDHFLYSDVAERWVADHRLVPFELVSPTRVEGSKLPFVSQPAEWTDAQLFAAAQLTFELQSEAVEASYDLKDASAWNVLFDGCRPVFCDLLSFAPLVGRQWWAFGQYARHFVLPLLATRRVGLRSGQCFAVWRDGMPAEAARRLLGWTVLLSRYGPLLAAHRHRVHSSVDVVQVTSDSLAEVQRFRRRLHAALDWQLRPLMPQAAQSGDGGWSRYEEDRPHYGGESLPNKRRLIAQWLRELAPSWVLDLGCNTGEFSKLSLDQGAQVIALDADHDSVQRLFQSNSGNTRLHPLVASLDDLPSSRGWGGHEHLGLDRRLEGCADAVLMLAIIHHLAIGAGIPLREVARFAHRCARRALIVELLDEDDPQLVSLCRQRQRLPAEFTAQRQLDAFVGVGFEVQVHERLDGASRSLLLLTRHATA